MDFKLEHPLPDIVYKVVDAFNPPAEDEEPEIEYEYLEVEIEKTMTSAVYIKIPKADNFNDLSKYEQNNIITEAVDELSEFDWEEDVFGVLITGIREMTEKQANQYDVYEVP